MSRSNMFFHGRVAAIVAMIALALFTGIVGAQSIPISQIPLFSKAAEPPLMMMVMSRDEQLFNKAYTDYTDLDPENNNGIDTTYQDRFDYSGYFDPALCYGYGSGQFSASGTANGHKCSNAWSGNFLNWVTMSRLDVLRFVLYGGERSQDDDTTILERATIPNDLHAWAKVYSGSDIGSFTPIGTAPVTFCNASFKNGNAYGAPIMRAASGAYTEWGATALNQCNWREDVNSGTNATTCIGGNNSTCDDASKASAVGAGSNAGDFTVRVKVCSNANAREGFCEKYDALAGNGTNVYKPTGLLQKYGEQGAMRFGLLTGSFSKPRSGGVLRRNIGKLAGNTGTLNAEGCAPSDEINATNGRFCNQTGNASVEGIVKTMNALVLNQWSGSVWNDCSTYGILNRQGGPGGNSLNNPGTGGYNCDAWGNPLSEMYAEALRYISGDYGANYAGTAGFTNGGADLPGLAAPKWLDPYRSTQQGGNVYCATCSILVLSTGLNSFDSDEIPAVTNLRSAAESTRDVGQKEGISGNYLVGRIATGTPGDLAVGNAVATYTDLCTAKSVTDFSLVRGICPDVPATEGSYLLDGLAYDAWTNDLRPDLKTAAVPKPNGYKNVVKTFGVSLAESLPKFSIPIGGGTVTMAPFCQANNSGDADALGGSKDKEWRSCFLGSVSIGPKTSLVGPNFYTYGRALESNGSAGSFSWVWEDSLWGNDHDLDVLSMVTYCVGAQCDKSGSYAGYAGKDICWRTRTTGSDASPDCGANGTPTVAADEALIRIENLSAYAGNAMLTGYALTGSNNDGVKRLALRPGGNDGTVLTYSVDPPGIWYKPMVIKYKLGAQGAKQLENPLFYAAKYGSFKDANNNGSPDPGEWDANQSGVPDNYFAVTNPAKLKQQLSKIFDQVVAGAAPTGGVAASGSRFTAGGTLGYKTTYLPADWTGDVQAFPINNDGSLGADASWTASVKLQTPAARKIFTNERIVTTLVPAVFTKAGLTNATKAVLQNGPAGTTYPIDDVINYLRGDQSKETTATPRGPYRARTTRIGDIVGSNAVVSFKSSYGYQSLPSTVNSIGTGQATYQNYVTSKPSNPAVFVGANDGMLHAFNGAASGGEELFAYIPNAVIGKLNLLLDPAYSHTYYVDGTPAVGDIYAGGWKTVLVGSAGAGARSVFGLDVSNPSAFTKNNVLWELNSDDDSDLGYSLGVPATPTITADGRWVTAVGNGYNSARGRAVLFVLDANTGEKLGEVDTGYGGKSNSANCGGVNAPKACPNGLSSATIVDIDGDGVGDTVYAGDYQGNMWKFDKQCTINLLGICVPLTGTSWRVAHNGKPLFTARDANGLPQPITGGVYAVPNALGGVIIYFGTGKYFQADDANPDSSALVNSIYGVWDNPNNQSTTLTRTDLQQQTVTGITGNDDNGKISTSSNLFDYQQQFPPTGNFSKMGFYLDLTYVSNGNDLLKGDRVIVAPNGILGNLLVYAYRPTEDQCNPEGVNSFFELDQFSGSAAYSSLTPPAAGVPTTGIGGANLGQGAPLGTPNPITSIPGQPTIPSIGCPDGSTTCTPNSGGPPDWCTASVAGYPNCAPPGWCPGGGNTGSAGCIPPAGCSASTSGFPYYGACAVAAEQCKWFNPGTTVGNQIACRVSWRQLR